MKSLSKENLIEHYRVLQQAYKGLAKDHAVGNSTPAALSPEDLEKKVAAQSSAVHKGTKKQMKWQPSCKMGRTKWSYTGICPNKEVFLSLFNRKDEKKACKRKKISISDFETAIGSITASVGYLNITGTDVTLGWNQEEGSFILSGTYGI
ncbi:MAG: hypothetical protein MMC23_007212 [Stictis urceolatum]|nr:hypothetical protein [Stictis urceolata]